MSIQVVAWRFFLFLSDDEPHAGADVHTDFTLFPTQGISTPTAASLSSSESVSARLLVSDALHYRSPCFLPCLSSKGTWESWNENCDSLRRTKGARCRGRGVHCVCVSPRISLLNSPRRVLRAVLRCNPSVFLSLSSDVFFCLFSWPSLSHVLSPFCALARDTSALCRRLKEEAAAATSRTPRRFIVCCDTQNPLCGVHPSYLPFLFLLTRHCTLVAARCLSLFSLPTSLLSALMFSPTAKPAKAGVTRPVFRVCYLCGQQFGTASIGIHVPQCYQKKLSQWQKSDPGIRGPKPKHPDTVNWKGTAGVSAEQINEEQYETFNSQLVPCPNCKRTFLPDRLPVHLRGCKGEGGRASSTKATPATIPSRVTAKSATTAARKPRGSTSTRRSPSSGPPLLPTCYLCGQQFGTASIGIHVPQCYEKKLAQWKNADPRTRGQPPKHPDSVKWKGRPDATASEQAAEQFQEFMNNLDPCPNCGRKFLPDRLAVHLRSCRPGNTAKPPPTRSPTNAAAPAAGDTNAAMPRSRTEKTANGEPCAAESTSQQSAVPVSTQGSDERHDPKRNRLSRTSPVPVEGRTCPQCKAVEYDSEAKFCRECGGTLDASKLPVPCVHCGERIPQGSRFCCTCGQPVNNASAQERMAGGTNVNASTVRLVVCPACQAICDADGNFCDNCGAALGDTDVAPTPPQSATKLPQSGPAAVTATKFCPTCKTPVADLAATFCEDCGSRLQVVQVPATADGGPPSRAASTLPPEEVARLSTSKNVTTTLPSPTQGSEKRTKEDNTAQRSAARVEQRQVQDTTTAAPTLGGFVSKVAEVGPEEAFADEAAAAMERVPCSHCGRQFAPAALARHEKICANQKTRRVFNAAKQRQPDDALPVNSKAAKKPQAAAAPAAPKHDWKAESEAFRRALREARQADQVLKAGGTAKDLPPPTYSVNPDYVQCPHCQRRFAPEVAQRHIPHCATTVNRPKPPPRRR
jgi:hypothetical protein